MKTISALAFVTLLTACGQQSQPSVLNFQEAQHEFTGKDAEDLIAKFEQLGLASETNVALREYGFHIENIHCSQVPSPRASAECQLTQAGKIFELDVSASTLVYERFVKNHAPLQLVGGVSVLDLHEVYCVRYEVYRGVSKCFFKN